MNIKNLLKNEITQSDLLNYYNATVIYEKLPPDINGFVFNYDGIFFIIIDKLLCYKKKNKTILHELAHIELSQLECNDKDLFATCMDKYEDEANKYLEQILFDTNVG